MADHRGHILAEIQQNPSDASDGAAKANAIVMAAAPELLQALREVAGDYLYLDAETGRQECVHCGVDEAEPHEDECTMRFVFEAIAKAEGRAL